MAGLPNLADELAARLSAHEFLAEVAPRELEHVLLEDALRMVRLYGDEGDPKYTAACRRYLARWLVEESPSLEDIAATACLFVERKSG